jgi:NADPH-dependent curcumin reductase CurA
MEAKSVHLKTYCDEGMPGPEHFDITTTAVNVDDLQDGDIVVKASVMSPDPYLRSQIKNSASTAGLAPKPLGSVMSGFIAGKVIASKNPKWTVGDLIGASLPFQTVQIVSAAALQSTVAWKLTDLVDEAHVSHGVGVLGMPGSTAYGGLIDVLAAKHGETIFISGAAGAVGGLVGQIAKKIFNCTVIGSCGGADKCEFIKTKFGFDHAIDYKQYPDADSLTAAIKAVAPNGIDMYFDNVGGIHFEAAFSSLRPHGRIAVCGGISQYNQAVRNNVSINPLQMIYTYQRIEGFMCMPWLRGVKGNFFPDMSRWLKEGKFHIQETNFEGIENWPAAFQSLFTGGNFGKVVVRV